MTIGTPGLNMLRPLNSASGNRALATIALQFGASPSPFSLQSFNVELAQRLVRPLWVKQLVVRFSKIVTDLCIITMVLIQFLTEVIMAGKTKRAALLLTEDQRTMLKELSRSRTAPAREIERAKGLIGTAEGAP